MREKQMTWVRIKISTSLELLQTIWKCFAGKKSKLPTKWSSRLAGGTSCNTASNPTDTPLSEAHPSSTAARTYTTNFSTAAPIGSSASSSATPNVSYPTTPRSTYSPTRKLSPNKAEAPRTGIQRSSSSKVNIEI